MYMSEASIPAAIMLSVIFAAYCILMALDVDTISVVEKRGFDICPRTCTNALGATEHARKTRRAISAP